MADRPNPDASGVIGLEQMLGVLKELPGNLQKNALASIARAGAVHLKKETEIQLGMVMARTVRSDDIIVVKRRSPKGSVRAEYNVGPPTRKPQLRWLHNGVAPHVVDTTHAQVLASATEVFGTDTVHPGQPPRPYLERAYFLSQNENIRVMARQTAKALARQTKILASAKYRHSRIKNIRRHFGGGRSFG